MFQKVCPWATDRFDWRTTDTSSKTSRTLYLETTTAFLITMVLNRKTDLLCVRAHLDTGTLIFLTS